jgi:hypothetical protein
MISAAAGRKGGEMGRRVATSDPEPKDPQDVSPLGLGGLGRPVIDFEVI